ncbi:MAG: glycerol-3-phosphate 1-O-acyltransferase PlsY [Succiniclasticum sp.]|jgi:acyl phosphate:glycerol-3-phosphate acyltransferase
MQLFATTAAPLGLTGFFPAVLVFFFLGYLFGSIPTGLWLCKMLHHIDIRQYGSGNIGATNVFRTVGPKTAALVLICDMLKGIVPLYVADHILAGLPLAVAITALGALLGHNYSFLLRFRGGKGVATGLGLFLYMLPLSAGVGFLFWIVIVAVTRYVSLGSVIGALAAAVSAWLLGYPWAYAAFGTLAAIFVIVRHKDNLKRLANGTESKIKPGHLNK